ncbi:hypothetical protein LN650_00360 [Klebsiella pneumoniae subsp. pneumoniae]|nr:hypothetical protein [Klebsiella pneumoniae subsp. pneumoniae]
MMIVGDDDQSIMAGAARRSGTFSASLTTSPARKPSAWSRTIARPAIFSSAANALIENNNGRLGKSCGPTAPTASRFRCTAPSTISTKRALW